MGKPGEAKGIEGEWGAGWENGREGDREEEKQQMRFKRNGNTRQVFAGEWSLMDELYAINMTRCFLSSFSRLKSTREQRKKESLKNKGVVFFSPLRISGTDIWIKPGMWRD